MRGTPSRVAVPLARGDRHRRHHRQPGGLQHDLHVGLVHADRAGEHAGADVADAGHLEHALDGAVLAPRAVQQREDDVDLAERLRRLRRLVDDQVGARRSSRGQGDAARSPSTRGQLVGALDPQPLGVAGLEHPAAVGGDADRHHVVRRRGRSPAARCRRSRSEMRVLAGAAAEDDGDAGLAGLARVGSLIGADPTGPAAPAPRRDARTSPTAPWSPATTRRHRRPPAARARPAAERADHDGVDVRRGRRPGVRPLRQPDLDGVRGGARRARGRPLPGVLLRAGGRRRRCSTWSGRARRSSRRGTPTTAP